MLLTWSTRSNTFLSRKNPIRVAKMSWVSNSAAEPRATCRNWINSFFEFLAAPSAILLGIETADRLVCILSP